MRYKRIVIVVCLIIIGGFLLPEPRVIPVVGATKNDWNKDTFWFEPWGSSGTHKGIDIFSDNGRPVIASTHLLILYTGTFTKGGKVVVGLGPKWRIHYFAHFASLSVNGGTWANAGQILGSVGDTGNAIGKPPHLHYSLVTLLPYPWRIDGDSQGYKKAFYLDPSHYFSNNY
ncbi:MAG: M23 family metallopeptidase [Cellvibrionaceae bacterium]